MRSSGHHQYAKGCRRMQRSCYRPPYRSTGISAPRRFTSFHVPDAPMTDGRGEHCDRFSTFSKNHQSNSQATFFNKDMWRIMKWPGRKNFFINSYRRYLLAGFSYVYSEKLLIFMVQTALTTERGDIRNDSNLNEIHPWYSGYVVEKMPEQWWNEFGKRRFHWFTKKDFYLLALSLDSEHVFDVYDLHIRIFCAYSRLRFWCTNPNNLCDRLKKHCVTVNLPFWIRLSHPHARKAFVCPNHNSNRMCSIGKWAHLPIPRLSPANTYPRFGPGIQKNLSINQVFLFVSQE